MEDGEPCVYCVHASCLDPLSPVEYPLRSPSLWIPSEELRGVAAFALWSRPVAAPHCLRNCCPLDAAYVMIAKLFEGQDVREDADLVSGAHCGEYCGSGDGVENMLLRLS